MDITSFKYAGPYILRQPFIVDSTNVNAENWTAESLLKTPVSFDNVETASEISANKIPAVSGYALHLLSFDLENTRYGKGKITVEGIKSYEVYVDGELKEKPELELNPATHRVVIKYLSTSEKKESPKVSFDSEQDGIFSLKNQGGRMYTLADVLHGARFSGVQLSPSGKYLISSYRITRKGGKTSNLNRVTDLETGNVLSESENNLSWMPRSDKYYYTRDGVNGKELVTVEALSGKESVVARNIPDGRFQFSPTEDYLLFSMTQEGPKERKEIFEVIDPDDRQPGWRDRSYIAKFDLATGVLQPVTFGFKNVWATDISADGKSALLMVSTHRMGKRPTSLSSLYKLDLETLQAETLVEEDGFINNAIFSPDMKQVLVSGSPESFGGIGKNVREGQTPSMTDGQLYLMDIASREVRPLTKDFNPSVQRVTWSAADNKVYFTAENRDYYSLYRLDPSDGKISQIPMPEDLVLSFSAAENAPRMAFYGVSASNSHRMYTLDLATDQTALQEDLCKDILAGIELGKCEPWNFVNSRGDTIYGRFYLPPHFDADKKYPMIVNYYGGCSPTSRDFESRYPHHAYAALGYVVYIVEPSGATGFGQEFSARHVNTFGEMVADDIIEGTKRFCEEHSFVDADKIGCIGASYGGFMTQYLQTKTDIFAAAISHAGISDHTSYWGEGFWGYSYSEVSGANSYPWANKELFVDRSPLYNADKIHTPILFLHGTDDNNVPVGESIQMYTALKLLERETAMVLVDGQDHHILDYDKRFAWQNTIFAWFAKWLQDDPTWWNTLYKPKTL